VPYSFPYPRMLEIENDMMASTKAKKSVTIVTTRATVKKAFFICIFNGKITFVNSSLDILK
jgi:hypothetical protein